MTREQTPTTHPDSQLLAELEELLGNRRYESVSRLVAESWLHQEGPDPDAGPARPADPAARPADPAAG